MRKKLFCALMTLSVVLSSGVAYAAEPKTPSEESLGRIESLDEVYEYDEEIGGMVLTGRNESGDELLRAGDELPKIDAPTNARWEESTGNLLFGASVNGTGIYYYAIYKEGEDKPVYTGSIHFSADYNRTELEMGLSEYALEVMDTGRYYFTIYAKGNESYSDSDICRSDILDYKRPERKLVTPYDLKWDKTTARWSLAEDSAIAYQLQCKEEGSEDWEWGSSGFFHRNPSVNIVSMSFTKDMNKKGIYRFRILAMSNNIFDAVDSEWSDWSPEISSEDLTSAVADELNKLLDRDAGADEILDALEKKDTEDLAVSIQTDSEIRDAMEKAEQRFAGEKGINVNTAVASDMSDKLSGGVSILGAAFNAGADVRNMTLNITKPTIEKEVDKQQYKNVVQINMTLDGAADTQNLKVPVRITMPIPAGLEPANLQILHYHNDGTYETIWPYISEGMASFTLTSFSTFVFANSTGGEQDLPEDCPFSDVKVIPGNWKYESIRFVYLNGIMNGISGTTRFEPDEPLNRAMFATVLYRMAGEPAVQFKEQFEDVEAGNYYSEAVIWAYEQGIIQGLDGGKRYGTNENITREQIAKMLNEYGKRQGYVLNDIADIDSFPDRSNVSGWAVDYMKWAVGSGMINGRNMNGTYYLDPRGEATRAECAAMLMRFQQRYK